MTQRGEVLPQLRGRYTCVDVLGQGTMARTYKAVDEESGRLVAVKVLHPSRMASIKEFELFEREAATLARLNHHNIPRYIDHFEHNFNKERTYCMVQEHIDGLSLAQRLEGEERLDEAAVVKLGLEVLEVLAYLGSFERPVVHRDIKPSNLVTGPDGALRLVDFGAVREAVRQTIQAGSTVIGTYGYMPPEQLTGEARPASDLFALGVTLVQCLTRRPASSLSQDGFTIRLDRLNLTLSPGLRQVLEGMLATRLEDRYANAEHVLADLRAVQAGKAPVYVDKLTRQRASREKAERQKIQRRLSTGMVWFYRAVVALALSAFGVAVTLIVTQTRDDLNQGLVFAGAVSAAGLVLSLGILGRRYIDDAWEPPGPDWRLVKGRIVSVELGRSRDVESSSAVEPGAHYTFTLERRNKKGEVLAEETHTGTIQGTSRELLMAYATGQEVQVRYNPAVPANHYIEVDR